MVSFKKKITILFLAIYLLFTYSAFSEEKNVLEVLEIIQKDLKTLERAVYSDSITSSEFVLRFSELFKLSVFIDSE